MKYRENLKDISNFKIIMINIVCLIMALLSFVVKHEADMIWVEDTNPIEFGSIEFSKEYKNKNAYLKSSNEPFVLKLSDDYYLVSDQGINECIVYSKKQSEEEVKKDLVNNNTQFTGVAKRLPTKLKKKLLPVYSEKGFSITPKEFEQKFSIYLDMTENKIVSTPKNILYNIISIIMLIIGVFGILKSIVLFIKKNKKTLKKMGISKIIFILSFIPYLIILLYAIFCAFFGFADFFHTSYGFDAFFGVIFIIGFLYWPIFIIVFIYQIIYIIVSLLNNKNHNVYK